MQSARWTALAAIGALWAGAVAVQTAGPGAAVAPLPAADGQQPPLVDFASEIRPLIEENCLECHNQDKRKGGLALQTYDDILEGGRSGPIVRPGRGADSLMLHRLRGDIEPQMPDGELALFDDEIALIQRWIDQGARPDPASPPAPPPWEAPLELTRPSVPDVRWAGWERPLDRLVANYLAEHGASEAPAVVSDARFARRAYLDTWGLLPAPGDLEAFLADARPDKRDRLVARLLANEDNYAEHWISFWNDLLRNEDGVNYYSEDAGRKSITSWLLPALQQNLPYDRFVTKLLDPAEEGDPAGFLIGVNWRGERSAAVTPWMQASQNTAQVFLGVNLKCNACHDSFVSRWKLMDAYSMAAFFSPEPRLQLFRCDVARDEYATPGFLYPSLNREPASASLDDRRAAVAAIVTDPRNGRMPRTIVNRVWERLLGRGIVPDSDEMDGKPWSPEVLDWVASDFVDSGYDLRHLIATIIQSRAYQMPAVAREREPSARKYVFEGPELRRLTAEQFVDVIGTITGEWSVYPVRTPPAPRPAASPPASGRSAAAATEPPDPLAPLPNAVDSDARASGAYGRQWRAASTDLTRALGRPIRDQVISVRPTRATTLQMLELLNGRDLNRWLLRGAQRMLDALPPEPVSLYTKSVGGRNVQTRVFDVDVSRVSRLWLVVEDTGSNAPERVQPVWSGVVLVDADGRETPLTSLTPAQATGLRQGSGPPTLNGTPAPGLRVSAPSRLMYDLSGRQAMRLRGTMGVENEADEIGSTLNPALRFYVFDQPPNMDQLVPVAGAAPEQPTMAGASAAAIADRVFGETLGRAPSEDERRLAVAALRPEPGSALSARGLADLLWAVMMKPEFQLIY
jgi:Protein of unknown function (DUF1549)/Protein of unknown function (DUF1553)/Planctomycete cytochrome C